ncbi:MAG: ATP-dependent DNA helicase RecG [Candidatus Berkiella sp.]
MNNTLQRDVVPSYVWFDSVLTLKGVGESISEKLAKLDIVTLGDVLLHFPYRYQDRTRLVPIRDTLLESEALIQGTIIGYQEVTNRRKQLIVTLEDGSGIIRLVFFHYYANMLKSFKPGALLRCFGEVKLFQKGKTMVHPEYQLVTEDSLVDSHLCPVYASVSGISQNWWRKIIRSLLTYRSHLLVPDPIWEKIIDERFGIDFLAALEKIHLPTPDCDKLLLLERKDNAYQRLIFEELLAHRTSLARVREINYQHCATPLLIKQEKIDALKAQLPFTLTSGQEQAFAEIQRDLAKDKPMLRLLQGDVGSGKTVIALLSASIAIENNKQVAIMAPTEVLAGQLFQQFQHYFSASEVKVALLVGSLKEKQKNQLCDEIKEHHVHIIVGTHALFQDRIHFADLGLVVIDEQHRFGVHQRLSLNQKGGQKTAMTVPHQLIMTATPIPRTLCMSYYTHLDTSQILTLPQGRKSIQTVAVSNQKRDDIIVRIQRHCEQNEQVYWVCALVDESEHLEAQAANDTYLALKQRLPNLSIGLVHGKLKANEKEAIMNAFYAGEIHLLVATTVIEVGVNVPNATLMVIENAERFGLSQLHQLRGRVGRGAQQSYCVLLYQTPLSHFAKERLMTMRSTTDGFEIAEKDLQLRGPGEVLGTRQSGLQQLKVAHFARDFAQIPKVNQFLSEHPLGVASQQLLMERWFKRKTEYAKV